MLTYTQNTHAHTTHVKHVYMHSRIYVKGISKCTVLYLQVYLEFKRKIVNFD